MFRKPLLHLLEKGNGDEVGWFNSFIMRPHADDFDRVLGFKNLINEPVLDVDPSGVGSGQIADELFIGRGIREGILGKDHQ